ncbi:bifunctional diaminohydroxyphosphoribosylaminopyrimidine deaminase/5-amino-6-(5-phosphoribosylamino)uracil reductase RibD [Clostridium celatum]|uniref:bifunctional diaminohydroxyphosphoribosylaminopyrimidine deaminase/5-amino-6-(5-phosphoribosylamino)uracil reductase RibD n=1 Tax=Clostridium celatum TaxID=36834 RepID=UPI00034B84EE|nr:bifunctional diaminohydroxyphosphoribosylaminopyrimidine deaminase/5-amino-6-(5-phosphoribosylamino)uracil reductase RibD [Clostridium celatum]MCE9655138.1 bifunctional diaminohydroxyphosphoribosylaminopyrimidine deaminase/5-amino-6-(5-phosphoribosylamino)uracil reductase RibD [Clostridium celatum]
MDKFYMNIALQLAKKGKGKVNPNPLVGAIIVRDGVILGRGYHKEYGKAHAEVNAFLDAKEDITGATMYVILEPCSHYGKTPPCVERIIENKISRVVIGMIDPNPLVAGKGIEKLKKSGITVTVGVLEEECRKLNEVFIKYITKNEPFVVLKTAMSLDGKIATSRGESKWITGEKARNEVHNLRNELEAIMVGVDTVIIDNPELTCRLENGRNPIRIIVDSTLKIPLNSKVLKNQDEAKTIVATKKEAIEEKVKKLEALGVTVLKISDDKEYENNNIRNKKVNLNNLMKELGKLNIDGVLLEGGATLNYSALQEGIVDKIQVYIAPKIIGGLNSKGPVGGTGIDFLKDAFKINDLTSKFIGEDILIEGYIEREES